ncbi:MAG: tRNA uridine-5-carboxymethylaminomethyl(34) synthesis GTPase MnmE [Porticoccaceae bacterium]|nr:tRNA uridine-5-carboxymethylaminomethyl(34) synthesis GTPase MnmE [Porticoccaceae bacterium]
MESQNLQNNSDTIVAIATAPGKGGIGVIRISGTDLSSYVTGLLGEHTLLTPRQAHYASFYDADSVVLDQGLALSFPAPNSFTGEHVLELHGHGGPVVLDSIVNRCVELGARLARPGEFSERAFLNDKLDLAQAEAVADLIDASSSQAAKSAVRSLQGEFSTKIRDFVERMIAIRVFVEAAIDFPEEEIDFLADSTLRDKLYLLRSDLSLFLSTAEQGALLRDGITLVLAGKPNAGKSSLLNALSGQDAAIVTAVAGTTRDVLREKISLNGIPLNIIDTAGLRNTDDLVEREGVSRAWKEIEKADAVLYVVDAVEQQDQSLEQLWPEYFDRFPEGQHNIISIFNKQDLIQQATPISDYGQKAIGVSAKTGDGLNGLKHLILASVGYQEQVEGVFSARRRHLSAIGSARDLVCHGIEQLELSNAGELLAEDLREAQRYLSEITGEFTSDDLLGVIFSSFCIGK